MHFQISLPLRALLVIRDLLCLRDIDKKTLKRLLVLLILKCSYRRCTVEKSVLKYFANFTGKQLESLFNKEVGVSF